MFSQLNDFSVHNSSFFAENSCVSIYVSVACIVAIWELQSVAVFANVVLHFIIHVAWSTTQSTSFTILSGKFSFVAIEPRPVNLVL